MQPIKNTKAYKPMNTPSATFSTNHIKFNISFTSFYVEFVQCEVPARVRSCTIFALCFFNTTVRNCSIHYIQRWFTIMLYITNTTVKAVLSTVINYCHIRSC